MSVVACLAGAFTYSESINKQTERESKAEYKAEREGSARRAVTVEFSGVGCTLSVG
jgi:hypothetical protein